MRGKGRTGWANSFQRSCGLFGYLKDTKGKSRPRTADKRKGTIVTRILVQDRSIGGGKKVVDVSHGSHVTGQIVGRSRP